MTDYRTIEVDLTGITAGDILSYDSTAKKFKRVVGANGQVLTRVAGKWIAATPSSGGGGGGGGGGLPDPPMVQLSKPTIATIGSEQMVGWDGLDYLGAPMPNGFARAVLERSSVSTNTTDATSGYWATTTEPDANPYIPPDWAVGPSSGVKVVGHKVVPDGTHVGESTALGGLQFIYYPSAAPVAKLDATIATDVGGVGIVVASNADLSNCIVVYCYSPGSTYVLEITSAATNGMYELLDASGPALDSDGCSVEYTGSSIIIRDRFDVVVGTYTPLHPHTGTNHGIALGSGSASSGLVISRTVIWDDQPLIDVSAVADVDPFDLTSFNWVTDPSCAIAVQGHVMKAGTASGVGLQGAGTQLMTCNLGSFVQKIFIKADNLKCPTLYFGATGPSQDDMGRALIITNQGPAGFAIPDFTSDGSTTYTYHAFTWDPDGMTFEYDGSTIKIINSVGTTLYSGYVPQAHGTYLGVSFGGVYASTYNGEVELLQASSVALTFSDPQEIGSLTGPGAVTADGKSWYSWRAVNLSDTSGDISERVELNPSTTRFASLPDVSTYVADPEAIWPRWNAGAQVLELGPPPSARVEFVQVCPGVLGPTDAQGASASQFTREIGQFGDAVLKSDGVASRSLGLPGIWLPVGTYQLRLDALTYTDGGILTIYIGAGSLRPTFANGVGYTVGTYGGDPAALVDCYSADPTTNVAEAVIEFTVSNAGRYEIGWTSEAKNSSSTGYRFGVYYMHVFTKD